VISDNHYDKLQHKAQKRISAGFLKRKKKILKGIEPNPIRTDNLQETPNWNLTRYRCAMGPVDVLDKNKDTINFSASPPIYWVRSD
jgi:hypothetical protein